MQKTSGFSLKMTSRNKSFTSWIHAGTIGLIVLHVTLATMMTKNKEPSYAPLFDSHLKTEELLNRLNREQIERRRENEVTMKPQEEKEDDNGDESEQDTGASVSSFTEKVRERGFFGHDDIVHDDVSNQDGNEEGPMSDFEKELHRLRDELLVLAKRGNHTTRTNKSKNTQWKLVQTPPNQTIEFLPPVLPPPNITIRDTKLVVLVPSHQGSFLKREAIRKTWKAARATQNSTSAILFVVAQSNCTEFQLDYENGREDLELKNNTEPMPSSLTCDQIDHRFLQLEQERNQDLLEIPMKEEYSRLPEKMMQAYNWALTTIPSAKWVAKADDDMFVNVANLDQYLLKYNPNLPMVIGEIVHHSKVAKIGKWAEPGYDHEYYPYWPKGSAGHVLSRAAVEYFVVNSESLFRYQGEDTCIGIWLDEAQKSGRLKHVTYIYAKKGFLSGGDNDCRKAEDIIMVGHELNPNDQVACLEVAGGIGPTDNAWIDNPSGFQASIQQEIKAEKDASR